MKKLVFAIAIVVLGVQSGTGPAPAQSAYPWCPQGRLGWGEAGAPSCGFSSYDQCVAASGGACTQNPFYTGPSGAASGSAVRRGRTAR